MSNKVRYLCGCEADGDLVAFHCPQHDEPIEGVITSSKKDLEIMSGEKATHSYRCGCHCTETGKIVSRCAKHEEMIVKDWSGIMKVIYGCGCTKYGDAFAVHCPLHDEPIIWKQNNRLI